MINLTRFLHQLFECRNSQLMCILSYFMSLLMLKFLELAETQQISISLNCLVRLLFQV